MPSANQFLINDDTLRLFIYGPAKSRKTWWALKAAEAGFRVLLFDFERGASIVNMIDTKARERIYILEAHDAPTDAYAAAFATSALKSHEFYFEEETRRVSINRGKNMRHCNMTQFGRDTVVVFDSYTALAVSTARQYAFQNNIDLADAAKTQWEGYRWCGALLTWMLTQMKLLRCHVICIGHETQYEKYKKHPTDPNKQGPLEWTRRQPSSTSNPHGMSITQHFTDVMYFHVTGRTAKIDTRGNKYEEGGGRHIPPDEYEWDKLQFIDIIRHCSMPVPGESIEMAAGFDFPTFEGVQLGGAKPAATTTNTTEAAPTMERTSASATVQPLSTKRTSLLFKKP